MRKKLKKYRVTASRGMYVAEKDGKMFSRSVGISDALKSIWIEEGRDASVKMEMDEEGNVWSVPAEEKTV